jgi:hypothetical protein
MIDELTLYQFKEHDLIQLTDGRTPFTLEENRQGWRFRHRLPATPEAVGKLAAKAASKVLDEVELQGYCQLDKFEIEPSWRKRWTEEGRREN